jgi:hypothetical protein
MDLVGLSQMMLLIPEYDATYWLKRPISMDSSVPPKNDDKQLGSLGFMRPGGMYVFLALNHPSRHTPRQYRIYVFNNWTFSPPNDKTSHSPVNRAQ